MCELSEKGRDETQNSSGGSDLGHKGNGILQPLKFHPSSGSLKMSGFPMYWAYGNI